MPKLQDFLSDAQGVAGMLFHMAYDDWVDTDRKALALAKVAGMLAGYFAVYYYVLLPMHLLPFGG